MLFMHAGTRPLWPEIAFLPWLVLGLWCILTAARQRVTKIPGSPERK